MTSDIWVLDDHRAGTTNQAIALAEELGLKYEIKGLKYNFLSFLPNIFFTVKPFHLNVKAFQKLHPADFPKLIISAGRKNAGVALYLKRLSKGKTKIVQIMKPGISSNEFDLIVLPQHDGINISYHKIVRIIGSLCRLNLSYDKNLFEKDYSKIKNFAGVLIGGDSKKYKFSLREATELCKALDNINVDGQVPLFITFSRRTPQIAKNFIKEKFSNNRNIIYDFEPGRCNPYHGILSGAKFLIATADSISLCSEVASTGKPLYIYLSDNLHSKKHRFFVQQLLDLGIAYKLCKDTDCLAQYSYQPLCEAKKVAKIVNEELLHSA
jgi:uncharacterized protein